MHDGDQYSLIGDCLLDFIRIYEAIAIDGKIGYLISTCLEELTGLRNGVMFNSSCDDMVSPLRVGIGDSFYS